MGYKGDSRVTIYLLVNFYYVKGIKNNEIVLENQKNIPIAQKRAAKFRKEFFDFLHKVYYVL